MPGRVADQVRDRFVNQLDPDRNIAPWTPEEDRLLTELQSRLGNKWIDISKLMKGRSDNAVKNRWYNRKTKHRRAFRRMAAEKQKFRQLTNPLWPLLTSSQPLTQKPGCLPPFPPILAEAPTVPLSTKNVSSLPLLQEKEEMVPLPIKVEGDWEEPEYAEV
jgi:hypothetical protein